MRKKVSNNVIRRLPRYIRLLDEMDQEGLMRVSSSELGERLGFTASQVRQDFSNFGEFGQQGYGYNIKALRDQIAEVLGVNQGFTAILVGVGHIGRSLISNFCFSDWGFKLIGAFDTSDNMIGKEVNGITVSSIDEIEKFISSHKVDAAVLTVPKEAAVKVAKRLTDCGINAIWNFTNVEIVEPDSSVLVENLHFSDSLLALSYYISEQKDSKSGK